MIYLKGLESFMNMGIEIYINGIKSKKEDLVKLVNIRNKNTYYDVRYIDDSQGNTVEIRFNKIKQKIK